MPLGALDEDLDELDKTSADEVTKSRKSLLLNRSQVRAFALAYCKRSPRCYVRDNIERVGDSFYENLESQMREWIRRRIDCQPSKGKTLK
jgi:hypothetical protein